jgi:hypothetical protein
MTAAAFSGQIQPSAWTSPNSTAAHTNSMTYRDGISNGYRIWDELTQVRLHAQS